jgi:hypothetical protein
VGVLIVVGILAIVVGVIYETTTAKSLPSILGQLHGYTGHRTKRAIAAFVVGGILLAAAAGLALYRPRR